MVPRAELIFVAFTLYYVHLGLCRCQAVDYKIEADSKRKDAILNNTSLTVRERRDLPEPTVAYYDFLVNEFSFKVWAVFEMVTIALLFYSTFAAIYYARWTYLRQSPPDDGSELFIRRSHERLIRALRNPPR